MLEAEMGESAIGLGHLVGIVAFLDGLALAGGGVAQFISEGLGHGGAFAGAGVTDDPAHREGDLAAGGDFHRDLIGGAADTAGLGLEAGLYVIDGLVKGLEGIDDVAALAGLLDGMVNDALGDGFLAVTHDGIDQLGHQRAAVTGIQFFRAFNDSASAGHG